MRYPDAVWRPGPAWKVNKDASGMDIPLVVRGVVGHSMVGYRAGAYSVLDGSSRASWHFSVYRDGSVEQHYDTEVETWHGQASNAFAIGIEHEGGYNPTDEPLTPQQLAASVALVRWLAQQYDFPLERHNGLWEHNEFAAKPCPSNRIPWDLYVEEEEDMLTQEQFNEFLRNSQLSEYQAIVEAFDNMLYGNVLDLLKRVGAIEAGVGPGDVNVTDLEAKVDAIKKQLAEAGAALTP